MKTRFTFIFSSLLAVAMMCGLTAKADAIVTDESELNAALAGSDPVIIVDGTIALTSTRTIPINRTVTIQGNRADDEDIITSATPYGVLLIKVLEGTTVTFKDLVFTQGAGAFNINMNAGSGTAVKTAKVVIENCIITDNKSQGEGAAIRARHAASVTIRNTIISNNVAAKASGTWKGNGGVYVHADAGAFTMTNCVLADNTQTANTTGNYQLAFYEGNNSDNYVYNNIFYLSSGVTSQGNIGGLNTNNDVSTANWTITNFYNNISTDATPALARVANGYSTSTLSVDVSSIFTDAAGGDFTLKDANSPAVNTGSMTAGQYTTTDITGKSIVGGVRDIGAYESDYTSTFTINVAEGALIGTTLSDLAGDGSYPSGTLITITGKAVASGTGYHSPYVSINGAYVPVASNGTFSYDHFVAGNITISIDAAAFLENVLPVTEDTRVFRVGKGGNEAINYSKDVSLFSRRAGADYENHRAYLKFTINAAIRSAYNKAILNVTKQPNSIGAEARTVPNNVTATSFASLNWNNSGEAINVFSGTSIGALTAASSDVYSIDLTNYIFTENATANDIFVQLAATSGDYLRLHSFENGNATYVPQLVFSYDPPTSLPETSVDEDNAPVRYYNLQGIEVSSPVKGNIYIVKQGAKATKMLVK